MINKLEWLLYQAKRFHITKRGALAFVIGLLVCAPLISEIASAQDNQSKDARYYVQQATKAYKEKDYSAYLENMKMATSLRPHHPTFMYNLAGAYALAGHRSEALAWLAKVADMGLIYPASKEDDFASIKDSDGFKLILKKFEDNKAPINKSASAFTVKEKGLIPESVAYDSADGVFYLSSVHKRKIVSIAKDGKVKDFATEQDGLWSVMGMKVDARRRHLWVCSAAHPQMVNYREEENGNSAVLKFDLRTGKLIKKYLLTNKPKAHWFGDLAVSSNGDVYVTDSKSPSIYLIRRDADELEPFIEGPPFVSLQGLDFSTDEKHLFVADYIKGIFLIDLRAKKVTSLDPPPGSTLIGIDGLYSYKGGLIAIQNGVNPHRVIRVYLNKEGDRLERFETIEANNPLFDEPTLGVLVNNSFYYVANSQWGAIDKNGKLAPVEQLREPVILKVKL